MERLYIARKARKLSQEDLANLLNMPTVTYGNYERGDSKPNTETLLKISQILDVSIDWLLENDNNVISFSPNEKEIIQKAINIINKKLFK